MADMQASVTLKLIDKLTGGLAKPRREFNRFRREAQNLQRQSGGALVGDFKAKGAAIASSLREQARVLREINRAERERLRTMRDVATAAGIYAGYHVTKKVIKKSADLETLYTDAELKFGGTPEEMAGFRGQIKEIAKELKSSTPEIAQSWDTLLGRGMDARTAVESLKTIGKIAKGSGADINDVSSTQMSLYESMGVKLEDLKKAQTTLISAGKEGAFEYEDIARYAPTMASAFKVTGAQGVQGTAWMGAAAQIIRKDAGTSQEVASRFKDVFLKTYSERVYKKFAEYDVDIRKNIQDNLAKGVSPARTIAQALKVVMANNPGVAVNNIYTDQESIFAANALVSYTDELRRMEQAALDAANANTLVDDDYARRMQDLNAKMEGFAAASERLAIAWGDQLAPAFAYALDGLTPMIEAFAEFINQTPLIAEGLTLIVGSLAALRGIKFASDIIGITSAFRGLRALRLARMAGDVDLLVDGINKTNPKSANALQRTARSFQRMAGLGRGGVFTRLAGSLGGLTAALGPWGVAGVGLMAAGGLITWLQNLPTAQEKAAKAADKHANALDKLGVSASASAADIANLSLQKLKEARYELIGQRHDLRAKHQATRGARSGYFVDNDSWWVYGDAAFRRKNRIRGFMRDMRLQNMSVDERDYKNNPQLLAGVKQSYGILEQFYGGEITAQQAQNQLMNFVGEDEKWRNRLTPFIENLKEITEANAQVARTEELLAASDKRIAELVSLQEKSQNQNSGSEKPAKAASAGGNLNQSNSFNITVNGVDAEEAAQKIMAILERQMPAVLHDGYAP